MPGAYVRPWLYRIGLDEAVITDNFRFYALMASFPGSNETGHLRPTAEQIQEHRPVLIQLLRDFQPDIVVPVGAMAIKEVLPAVKGTLSDAVGNVYKADPFASLGRDIVIVPWAHPSGRSTWVATHGERVEASLEQLRIQMKL
jgi:uracil-DNA glycosylase